MDPRLNQSPYGENPLAGNTESNQLPPTFVPGPGYGGYGNAGAYYPGASQYGYPYQGGQYKGYAYGGATAEFLSPRRLLKVLKRRWFLILMVTLIGTAAAVLYFWRAERVFRAEATLEMSVRGTRVYDDVVQQEFGRTEEVFNTRLGRLRGVKFGVEAEKNYLAMYDRFGPPTPADEIPEIGKISYDLLRLSRLVKISAESPNAFVAAISANAAAEAASNFFEEENRDQSDKAVEWLMRQREIQESVLNQAEDSLLVFRTENKLDTMQAQLEASRQSLLTLNATLVQQDNLLLQAREELRAIDTVVVDMEVGIKLPASMPNRQRIAEMVSVFREGVNERKVMLQIKTEKHPDVIALDQRLTSLAESIRNEVSVAKASYRQRVNVLEAQRDAIRNRINSLTESVSTNELKMVDMQSRLRSLIRDRDAAEAELERVLTRIQQARLAADEDAATVKVVEGAYEPEEPVSPKLIIVLPLGIIGGVGLGFLFALSLEAVEDRVFSIAELEAEITSRIIGIIPHISGGKRADLAMISLNQKFGQVAESFNSIRVLLDHINNTRIRKVRDKGQSHPGGQVVMFCSASPSEGKTVSATNVATTSARAGQKTLLIDCDMRRPRLAKVFAEAIEAQEGHDEKQYSLLHHLATKGGKDFEDIILPGPTEHLDLIASLSSNDLNPADLLGGDAIKNLIDWGRQNYDRIIIDTPPIGLISDGLVISGLSDGVVAVCRAGQTRHRALRHILLQFKGVGATVIGIIVNDFNMKKSAEPMDVHYRDFANNYNKSVYKEQETSGYLTETAKAEKREDD